MAEPYLKVMKKTIAGLELPIQGEVVLECKHFFSGAALYANGKICASLTPAGFGLKLSLETRNRLLADGDGKALRYFDGAPIKKEYVLLSQPVTDDPKRLKELVECSISFVMEDNHPS
jgi:TfoX/Sxy family transcriptional regulator of competence genes